MAGTLTISTLSDGTNSTSATNCIQGSAKAWVNYNGSTQTIKSSYNVSSITRLSTGIYTINFTNAMSDTNYAYVGSGGYGPNTDRGQLAVGENSSVARTTSALSIRAVFGYDNTTYFVDSEIVCVSIFR